VRRFTDKAGLPTSPVWEIVRETAERIPAAWKALAQKELLPSKMRTAIRRQIQTAVVRG